ncbi:MAG TPA: geopeptide radical SAM maturase [bacterium]
MRSACALTFPSDTEGKVILFSTKTAAAVLVPARLVEDIERGALEPDEERQLADLGLLVPDRETEHREMLAFVSELEAAADTLHLIVIAAHSCNLGCTYCYQGSAKGTGVISPAVSAQVIDFATAAAFDRGLNLKVTFYGGEPLLALEPIVSLAGALREAAAAHGCDFTFSLITNGTLLTRKTAARLRPLGLLAAQVTLDGPAHIHDAQRPLRAGGGSFRRILGNLQEAWDLLTVRINANYGRDGYEACPGLLDDLLAVGLGPERIGSVSFSPISRERRAPGFEGGCRSANEPWVIAAAAFLRGEALRRGYRVDAVRPGVCMVDLAHELVVDCDGSLYKCPCFAGDRRFCVGDVAAGVRDAPGAAYGRDRWRNETCLACPYLPLCFGGCRWESCQADDDAAALACRRPFFDAALGALVRQDLAHPLAARRIAAIPYRPGWTS